MKRRYVAAAALLCLAACKDRDTESPVAAPGEDKKAGTAVLETGAEVLQDKPPIDAINAYLDGFHFYNGRPQAQMEAHHYCTILNDDMIQCVIYDGNVGDAKLMGIEYIVSDKVFKTLPEAEKPLWHSHVHEVKSGQLVAPGIPQMAEHALMKKLVHTYGKTIHTWHTDQDKTLPLGAPQLMMGFTQDGQANEAMVEARNKRLGIDTVDKRANREDIPTPEVLPGADAWQAGKIIQFADPTGQRHDHQGNPGERPAEWRRMRTPGQDGPDPWARNGDSCPSGRG
ncbi:OBAP family protein [Bordetella genomosp. 13]|uniref:OBAP family protein n=1 Tax=Bordetella genomosp. 13 TaxID=463040 RepID=UPI00164313F0|nr:OBAP family protein [Bordetella genomosp. 13]